MGQVASDRFWVRYHVRHLLIFVVLIFSACQNASITEAPIITATLHLISYYTPTPSQTDHLHLEVERTPTPRPIPTATPYAYTVVKNDTMLGIAMRFGVSLEDLMAANPEVHPRFLSIGTVLVIPFDEDSQEFIPNPTPIPMGMADPTCYQSADGGLWCFLLIGNNNSQAVENVSARIALERPDGNLVAEIEATTPLSVLPGFRSMPVVVYFPPPLPKELIPKADLVSVLPLPEEDHRYLKVSIELLQEQISPHGLQGTISGNLSLADGQDPATSIWLVLIAYDDEGTVVGVRKWEAYSLDLENIPAQALVLEKPLDVGEKLPFEITVYSLGPQIANIDILVEARP